MVRGPINLLFLQKVHNHSRYVFYVNLWLIFVDFELVFLPVLSVSMISDSPVCRMGKKIIWPKNTHTRLLKACVKRWNTILIVHGKLIQISFFFSSMNLKSCPQKQV